MEACQRTFHSDGFSVRGAVWLPSSAISPASNVTPTRVAAAAARAQLSSLSVVRVRPRRSAGAAVLCAKLTDCFHLDRGRVLVCRLTIWRLQRALPAGLHIKGFLSSANYTPRFKKALKKTSLFKKRKYLNNEKYKNDGFVSQIVVFIFY